MSHPSDPDEDSRPGLRWLEGAEAEEGGAVIARADAYGDVRMYRVEVEELQPGRGDES